MDFYLGAYDGPTGIRETEGIRSFNHWHPDFWDFTFKLEDRLLRYLLIPKKYFEVNAESLALARAITATYRKNFRTFLLYLDDNGNHIKTEEMQQYRYIRGDLKEDYFMFNLDDDYNDMLSLSAFDIKWVFEYDRYYGNVLGNDLGEFLSSIQLYLKAHQEDTRTPSEIFDIISPFIVVTKDEACVLRLEPDRDFDDYQET